MAKPTPPPLPGKSKPADADRPNYLEPKYIAIYCAALVLVVITAILIALLFPGLTGGPQSTDRARATGVDPQSKPKMSIEDTSGPSNSQANNQAPPTTLGISLSDAFKHHKQASENFNNPGQLRIFADEKGVDHDAYVDFENFIVLQSKGPSANLNKLSISVLKQKLQQPGEAGQQAFNIYNKFVNNVCQDVAGESIDLYRYLRAFDAKLPQKFTLKSGYTAQLIFVQGIEPKETVYEFSIWPTAITKQLKALDPVLPISGDQLCSITDSVFKSLRLDTEFSSSGSMDEMGQQYYIDLVTGITLATKGGPVQFERIYLFVTSNEYHRFGTSSQPTNQAFRAICNGIAKHISNEDIKISNAIEKVRGADDPQTIELDNDIVITIRKRKMDDDWVIFVLFEPGQTARSKPIVAFPIR